MVKWIEKLHQDFMSHPKDFVVWNLRFAQVPHNKINLLARLRRAITRRAEPGSDQTSVVGTLPGGQVSRCIEGPTLADADAIRGMVCGGQVCQVLAQA